MDERTVVPRVVLGSGRSGTTWVQDCLAEANWLRPIFEPLHPADSLIAQKYAYQLIAPGDANELLERYFRQLVAGDVRSRWIDYRSRHERLFPAPENLLSIDALKRWVRSWQKHLGNRRRLRAAVSHEHTLIKCIRANLMAGWLAKSLGFRAALVIRHPGAVVESQFRLGSVWNPYAVRDRYRENRRLHEITGGRYLALLNSNLTELEALTLNWVIENQWPVESQAQFGYAVIYYENLLYEPEVTWKHLCRALELSEMPSSAVLDKPSQQSSGTSIEPGIPLSTRSPAWRERMGQDQIDTIQRILDITECDLYAMNKDRPLHSYDG